MAEPKTFTNADMHKLLRPFLKDDVTLGAIGEADSVPTHLIFCSPAGEVHLRCEGGDELGGWLEIEVKR